MAVTNTKIVTFLPSVTEPNTQYLVKNEEEKFDIFQTDNNNVIKQLQKNVNRNLMKNSPIMMLLYLVQNTGRPNTFITTRLWNEPSIYGMWEGTERTPSAVWGIHSIGEQLNYHIFEEDLRNKEITVSVDVMCPDYEVTIGLNERGKTEMPFTLEKGKWKRIHTTVTTTHLPGIVAKLKSNSSATGNHSSLTTNIYYRNWKVEYGRIATDWIPANFDLASSHVSYVKTHRLPTPNAFRTDAPIETRYQDGIQVGLASTNTTITIFLNKYTFKCRYIFLNNDSSVTFTGLSQIITNAPDGGKTLRGNRGDWVEFTYFQDQSNRMLAIAHVYHLSDNNVKKGTTTDILLDNGTKLPQSTFIPKGNDANQLVKDNGEKQNLSEIFKVHPHTSDIQPAEAISFWNRETGMYQISHPRFSEILLHFNTKRGSASALQLRSSYQDNAPLMVRKFVDNNRATVWKSLAWNDDLASKGVSWLGGEWTAPDVIFTSTVFLTGSGNKTIHLHQMQDQSILSFKKCYDGGTVTFTCAGKQIIMKGATSFNGAEGSNAVVSIVGNKCYIDVNNY